LTVGKLVNIEWQLCSEQYHKLESRCLLARMLLTCMQWKYVSRSSYNLRFAVCCGLQGNDVDETATTETNAETESWAPKFVDLARNFLEIINKASLVLPGSDGFTHRPNRPWPRALRFWGPRATLLWRLNVN